MVPVTATKILALVTVILTDEECMDRRLTLITSEDVAKLPKERATAISPISPKRV
jgi:hypothetical protein